MEMTGGIRGGIALLVMGVLTVGLSGCVGTACSAVGYIYTGPAVLEFSPPLDEGVGVAACFGAECEPAAIARGSEATWAVPQEPPFFESEVLVPGEERMLRVVVTGSNGAVVSDGVHEIPIRVERTGVFGECPGPFSFEPVVIDLG